jgi:uncharacterized protein (DUF488 family)
VGNRVGGAVSRVGRASTAPVVQPRHAPRRSRARSSRNQVPTVLTLGYQQRTIKEFIGLLVDAGVDVLIDVRETPWSHKPGFSKTALQARLAAAGIEYVHARFAGNPKRIRAKASSHAQCLALYSAHLKENHGVVRELEQLVGTHLGAGRRVCLTCYERHPDDCHRGILSAQWRAGRRRRVTHLATDGCPRLVSQPT